MRVGASASRPEDPSRSSPICALWKPDPTTKDLTVVSLHPGIAREQVRAATGWEVNFAERLEETVPPGREELAILRELYARTRAAHGDGR